MSASISSSKVDTSAFSSSSQSKYNYADKFDAVRFAGVMRWGALETLSDIASYPSCETLPVPERKTLPENGVAGGHRQVTISEGGDQC